MQFYVSKILNLKWQVCTCWSQRRTLGDLLYHCLSYSFETASLTKPGARLVTSNPPGPSVSSGHGTKVTSMCLATPSILHWECKLRYSSCLYPRCPYLLSQLPVSHFQELTTFRVCTSMTSVSLVLQPWKLICLESMAHAHHYSSKESQNLKQSQLKLKHMCSVSPEFNPFSPLAL